MIHEHLPGFGAFLLGFAVIFRFWWAHHRAFGHLSRLSGPIVILSGMWTLAIVMLPIQTAIITDFPPSSGTVALYCGTLLLATGALSALSIYAYHHPELSVGRTPLPIEVVAGSLATFGALLLAAVVGVSFPQINYWALFLLLFTGPAETLWRLSTVELIDVTGPIKVAADVTGSLGRPQVRGSLAGDALRVQSPLTGTDIRNVRARGRFSGSRLQLASFAGASPNGGRVSGSGFVDLAEMSAVRGPRMDNRLAMANAEVMNLANMGATVTGPMRIVSSGVGGTIAGRLRVQRAHWQLGVAQASQALPNIRTR